MSDYNKKSFCVLASEYHISIPLIQREYAQGRDDKQGEEVRKNFVPELIKVLTLQLKQLPSKRKLRRIEMRCSNTVCPEVMIRTGGRCIGCTQ